MGWVAHRKWKKIKQQPSMLPGPALPGCCLVSFHFLWAIHPIRRVQVVVENSDVMNYFVNLRHCLKCVEGKKQEASMIHYEVREEVNNKQVSNDQ